MGSACCVAARDKTITNRANSENLHRNIRYSPTWSFRWDNRVGVAGEDTSVSWLSDGISRNDGSISYSTIISGLCKAGRLDEAKKKFMEMMGKNLHPDSVIYDTFIHIFCKQGRISSAFRVLKDMEKKGCNKSIQTYNSLILGLGSKKQIFEIYGLMNEMKERGVPPDVCTYNNMMNCLCEVERVKDATSLLDEMLQKGISPNISTFSILIKAFCKGCDFGVAQEVFDIALSVCGHKEALYSLMFNELLAGGEVSKATELFEEALDKYFYLGNFLYKDRSSQTPHRVLPNTYPMDSL